MSTRSGKRIHSSFHENTIAAVSEPAVKSERKTRSISRRVKDNIDELSISLFKTKERKNYVSYPTDDELISDETVNDGSQANHSRVLRKSALKEINIKVPDNRNLETLIEPKTLLRKSRRGKKNAENVSEETEKVESLDTVQPEVVEKTKSKKKKINKDVDLVQAEEILESVYAKKSKKKKKKGKNKSSAKTEDVRDKGSNNMLNKSNMSMDSFHSAAGSPKKISYDEEQSESAFENNVEGDKTNHKRYSSIIDTVDKDISMRTDSINTNETNESINKGTKKRKSTLKDTTFDKSNSSVYKDLLKDADMESVTSETLTNVLPDRKSNINNGTYDKLSISILEATFEKDTASKKDSTYDKIDIQALDVTSEHTPPSNKKKNSRVSNATIGRNDKADDTTFEKDTLLTPMGSAKKSVSKKSSLKDNTFDKNESGNIDKLLNSGKKVVEARKSIINDDTFDKVSISEDTEVEMASSTHKRTSARLQNSYKNESVNDEHNSTFDATLGTSGKRTRKSVKSVPEYLIPRSMELNTTYEKENSKSSLISSDNSAAEKVNISRISITSDDSAENILNTTPVLIESSLDNSGISKQNSPTTCTPLKREGTFTKDGPDVLQDIKTPSKQRSMPAVPPAGCTPYHVTKSSQKSVLNITRSVEKTRHSVEAPRMTKVMFCSPIDNPAAVAQEKRKVIKSNLKGSNKSFVFEDSASKPPARKRSYTQNDAEDSRIKRKRLGDELQQSVNRLSRPRTSSATAKLTESTTPSKKPATPSKLKSDSKSGRTKLPNFAALHHRQFAKMESLDECQERKAKRAKQLLTPTGAVNMLERISPKDVASEPPKPKDAVKTDTPTKAPPTLESLRPGFTRFGFKLNLDVNPFSIPSKNPKPKLNGGLSRQKSLPSLNGTTSARREVAKQAVLREKSFTDKRNLVKRNENRTIIKGVRTNRRFELQMKLRNVE